MALTFPPGIDRWIRKRLIPNAVPCAAAESHQ
jgi:hypothetical protein